MARNGAHNADGLLLAALAGGRTVPDAAAEAGVSSRTVYRRLEDPTFRQQMTAARAELVAQAVGMLTAVSTEAVQTLRGLLAAEADSVKLGAARSILELGAKLREGAELEARIVALEAATPTPLRRAW